MVSTKVGDRLGSPCDDNLFNNPFLKELEDNLAQYSSDSMNSDTFSISECYFLCHFINFRCDQNHNNSRIFIMSGIQLQEDSWSLFFAHLGVGLLVMVAVLYGIKKYFGGNHCYIKGDLTGKVAVITGGNTGIGKETARKLAQLGCDVIFGARDEKKNRETQAEIQKKAKGAVTCFNLDLAKKESIEDFMREVMQCLNGRPLNFLINNAGVMAIPTRKTTSDGFEMQMGVNHLGHFYLTNLLWGVLNASENPRIINVSSQAHKTRFKGSDIDFKDMNFEKGYTGLKAYSRSKKANIMFTKELQRRMEISQVNGISISLHPGVVRTELARQILDSGFKRFIYKILSPLAFIFMKSAEEGAQTTIYGVLEREDKLRKGAYYADCRQRAIKAKQCEDIEACKQLWEVSETMLGTRFDV